MRASFANLIASLNLISRALAQRGNIQHFIQQKIQIAAIDQSRHGIPH